jgi:hypothetical protein
VRGTLREFGARRKPLIPTFSPAKSVEKEKKRHVEIAVISAKVDSTSLKSRKRTDG